MKNINTMKYITFIIVIMHGMLNFAVIHGMLTNQQTNTLYGQYHYDIEYSYLRRQFVPICLKFFWELSIRESMTLFCIHDFVSHPGMQELISDNIKTPGNTHIIFKTKDINQIQDKNTITEFKSKATILSENENNDLERRLKNTLINGSRLSQ